MKMPSSYSRSTLRMKSPGQPTTRMAPFFQQVTTLRFATQLTAFLITWQSPKDPEPSSWTSLYFGSLTSNEGEELRQRVLDGSTNQRPRKRPVVTWPEGGIIHVLPPTRAASITFTGEVAFSQTQHWPPKTKLDHNKIEARPFIFFRTYDPILAPAHSKGGKAWKLED